MKIPPCFFNKPASEEIECITDEAEHADKLICLTAALLEKSSHPWKEEVYAKAKQTCRTIRTAFHVEETKEGLKGKVNGSLILIGSCKFLQEHGVDCAAYELKSKRLARKGYEVLFAGKLGNNKKNECIGLITKHQEPTLNENGRAAASFIQKGWRLALLNNSMEVSEDLLSRSRLDQSWLSVHQGEVIERIAVLQQLGEDVLFVAGSEENEVNGFFFMSRNSVCFDPRVENIQQSAIFAEKMDQTVNEHFSVTKKWNSVGSALATLGVISAPVVNLAADALSLVFMSRSKKISESIPSAPERVYKNEIAATSEAVLWHAVPSEQVLGNFHVDQHRGLTSEQAASLRNRHGWNRLASKKSRLRG